MNSQENNGAVLIAGPTASGKSALALALAQATGGVIINADSMQMYRDLKIITARPSRDEEATTPHRLYGTVDAAVNFSAGAWVAEAAKVLAEARAQNRLPIFVGGSGLYFKALTRGLSAVPPIASEVRDDVRARLERDGVEALHAQLLLRDPVSAERLKPRDRSRIARALEVVEATGRSLTDWHREGLPPLLALGTFSAMFLNLGRDELYARIDARFDAMLGAGALEEVAALAARKLDPLLPAMKAHGVPALIRHLRGEISLEAAADISKADTRHYAKRQFTWFRHQLAEFEWVKAEDAERVLGEVLVTLRGHSRRSEITSAVGFAESVYRSDGSTTEIYDLGRVENSDDIFLVTGIDVKGFRRILDSGGVRHSMHEHGDRIREAARAVAQEPLDFVDFEYVPQIVRTGRILSVRMRKQKPTITYEAVLGEHRYTYVEEIRRSARLLATKTMFKVSK